MMIVLFEDPQLGHAEEEMFALGWDVTECFVEHCRKIDTGVFDVRRLALFAELEGIPIFQASVDNRFVVYAIEKTAEEATFMILAAGRHGVATTFGATRWNGYDYEALKRDVVLPRANAIYLKEGDIA